MVETGIRSRYVTRRRGYLGCMSIMAETLSDATGEAVGRCDLLVYAYPL